jgi:tryptophan synthase alpha chain
MTHVVAGYPDLETSAKLVERMAASGADLVEIQIPFSDPLADGPTITRANHDALRGGIRPEDCFRLVERLKPKVNLPLILMTYANIPFRMGIVQFVLKAADCGASGAIIPDLPFDEQEGGEGDRFAVEGLHLVPVLSPGMGESRLRRILETAQGMAYLTLKVGTTGALERTQSRGLEFIARVRSKTRLPLAAGFGISSAGQISALRDRADAVVIGSHVLDIFNASGLEGVSIFLGECRESCGID